MARGAFCPLNPRGNSIIADADEELDDISGF
jgi:hypothetical protein